MTTYRPRISDSEAFVLKDALTLAITSETAEILVAQTEHFARLSRANVGEFAALYARIRAMQGDAKRGADRAKVMTDQAESTLNLWLHRH